MSVMQLNERVNEIAQAPDMVMMNNLVGAAAEVVIDASLQPGAAQLELEPPDAFDATLTNGHLRVASTDAAGESSATLRLGPQTVEGSGPYISLRTTSGDVSARGTAEHPLRARGVGLMTNGEGHAAIEHAEVTGNVRLMPETPDKVALGVGVVANKVISRH